MPWNLDVLWLMWMQVLEQELEAGAVTEPGEVMVAVFAVPLPWLNEAVSV